MCIDRSTYTRRVFRTPLTPCQTRQIGFKNLGGLSYPLPRLSQITIIASCLDLPYHDARAPPCLPREPHKPHQTLRLHPPRPNKQTEYSVTPPATPPQAQATRVTATPPQAQATRVTTTVWHSMRAVARASMVAIWSRTVGTSTNMAGARKITRANTFPRSAGTLPRVCRVSKSAADIFIANLVLTAKARPARRTRTNSTTALAHSIQTLNDSVQELTRVIKNFEQNLRGPR